MFTYYHGTKNSDGVLDALLGGGVLRTGFHLAVKPSVAANYGRVIKITSEVDLTMAHVGLINKDGNSNASVGNEIEVVLKTPASINQLLMNLYDAELI